MTPEQETDKPTCATRAKGRTKVEVGTALLSTAVLVTCWGRSKLKITTSDPELLTYLRGYTRPVRDEEGWSLEMDPYQLINLLPSIPAFFDQWTLADSFRFNPRTA